jgi:glutathione synthase/RimK-type ligase-like ATP-grasp enzyme
MKIGIHGTRASFNQRWIEYCTEKKIDFKVINCYQNDVIEQLKDCDALMWHHSQNNPKDLLIAKPILFSLEQSGKAVFPDFNTSWHFDDKLGQKYLLESLGVSFVKSFAFFNKDDALQWASTTDYPVVFKLRRGAGSFNVKLVKKESDVKKIIRTATSRGFSNYNSLAALKEIIRKRQLGKARNTDVIKGIARLFFLPAFAKIAGRELGYVYFQEFIPENAFDIRVVVIGNKAFAIKRLVRENDFRASGSGNILYEKKHFDDATIKLAFQISEKLHSQCTAFDFIFKNGQPLIIEISYGFDPLGYDSCPGYWDRDLKWNEGKFNPYGWMVEEVIESIKSKKVD